ncbi:response regulator [Bradyrhizobium sp. CCGUVB1N3]|uniref:response regulator transcription factor n=1 Tax=Bradyrhizobium sp. CCGUVB1N3 TaxID=2949629 RepID=UPI0020B1CF33|nr:response regulator [Bradyrhizobium sp. CCGUVB1N3]MCP3475545.1 response regulator [Bradyrhizobium sp. CCGUVB1N3]
MSTPPVISVIDDDPSVRAATTNLLTSCGYSVQTFASAFEFLQSAELHEASCVISDIQMPAMSGLDLLRHVRRLGHHMPFILITAFPDDAVRARAIKAGAIGFLAKPLVTQALIKCVKIALEGSDGPSG